MKKTKVEPLKTILTIVIGLSVIYFITKNTWFLYIAFVICCISIISSHISYAIHYSWMKLALVMSYIMPTILLTLLFYAFLLPISLLSKLFKKEDLLQLKNKRNSTFVISDKSFNKQSFEKPW